MRILVTGATGTIGRRATPRMIAEGHIVTGVARSAAGRAAVRALGASAIALDLFDRAAVRSAVAGHDAVVNLATHMPQSTFRAFLPGAWAENDRIRKDASRVLADAAQAAGVEVFIQESFAPAYPDCGSRWIDENVALGPARYNHSILDAEASAARFAGTGRTGTILRFAFLYGPDDPFTREIFDVIKRGWMPFFGRPEAFLSMVTHEDAASAVVAALRAPGGVYNVVDDEPLTRAQFAQAAAALAGAPMPRFLPPWLASLMGSLAQTTARSLRISNRKLRNATRWAPDFRSLREGLAAAWQPEGGRPQAGERLPVAHHSSRQARRTPEHSLRA